MKRAAKDIMNPNVVSVTNTMNLREAAKIFMEKAITGAPVVDELGKDYVRAGRARGLSLDGVVARHVPRNAAIPVVTVAALEIGNLLAGAVIVETVFAWPGIGQLAVQSIQSRDFLVVQVVVLFISMVYVLVNLLADLVYALIDPRIRLATA